MKKRILSLLLSIAVVIGLLPNIVLSVSADNEYSYPVLGGVQFSEENLTIIDTNGGTATYNPEKTVLTLNDFTICNENGVGLEYEGELTLAGNGNISGSTYGVYTDGNLELAEGVKITFTGEIAAMAIGGGIGTTNVVITEPKNAELGGVDVGAEEGYTTYGTSDAECNFTPALSIKFEPGYIVSFDMSGSFNGISEQAVVAGGKAIEPEDVPPYYDGESTTEFKFSGWFLDEEYTIPYDFNTPVTTNVYLYAKWIPVSNDDDSTDNDSNSSDAEPTYRPIIKESDNGTVVVEPRYPENGEKVTIAVIAPKGYTVKSVVVTCKNGDNVKVTDNADGTYSFRQPAGKVTISVNYEEKVAVSPTQKVNPSTGAGDMVSLAASLAFISLIGTATLSCKH